MISVIVPVYNVEKYLHKCVDSIINQTYKDLEIILVDDGSPDNCPKICDEYAQKDNRIKVIHKENGGLSSARNAGLQVAIGDYIAFVDSDDYIDEHMYEKMYQAIQSSKCDICMCGCKIVKEQGKVLYQSSFACDMYNINEIIGKFVISLQTSVCNKLVSRNLIQGNKFMEGKVHGEDLLFCLNILNNTVEMVTIQDCCYYYVKHNDSITTKKFSSKAFDEVWCKDKAYSIIQDKFPMFQQQANIWRFRARMNLIRKITASDNKKAYKEEYSMYKKWVKDNYLTVKNKLKGKEKMEYHLLNVNKAIYKMVLKIFN